MHLSPSQIEMLCKCPQQWEQRYVHGRKIRPIGLALVVGRAVDRGATANYKQKIVTRQDAPLKMVEAETADTYDREVQSAIPVEDESVGACKDQAVNLIRVHYEVFQRATQPVLVQHPVKLRFEGEDCTVNGIVDTVAEAIGDPGVVDVIDNKTSSKKYEADAAAKSVQLTLYWMALRQQGRNPGKRAFHVAVKNTYAEAQLVDAPAPDDETIRRQLHIIEQALRVVRSGVFPPITGGWWCSPKWCGFWSTCKYHL